MKFQSQMEFSLRYMVNKNVETNFSIDDNHSQVFEDQLDDLQENEDLPALERAQENTEGMRGGGRGTL